MSEQSTTRVHRTRFVTLCQQLLALAVVVAVLTPAARTISMDVRPMPIDGQVQASPTSGEGLSAYLRAAVTPSVVPTGPVHTRITNYPLTAPRGARLVPGAIKAQVRRTAGGGTRIDTHPLPVTNFGGVGVTWAPGQTVRASSVSFEVRSREAGRWSGWTTIGPDDDGPDPGSAEARAQRPGTEALFVGTVDRVQVRFRAAGRVPAGLQVSVIDPGTPTATRRERPALDTSRLDGARGDEQAMLRAQPHGPAAGDALTLSAAAVTPKPQIFSRAQWGADERMRDKPSLHYGRVQTGIIHHTVQANNYSRGDVPALIRADYAYHTQTRGWSDIGYNYLIDRFGRIWEGRYGGVDRDPVGAHTLGYNDDTFGASAIGNFQTVRPTAAMVRAYAALFAWKLSLAGVPATATHQPVASKFFKAIIGHRDAGQTLCPGQYLYARIPDIRRMAAQIQASWAGRQLPADLAGGPRGDLVARRTSDGMGMILPINTSSAGVASIGTPVKTGIDLTGATAVLKVGDWDGDGSGDLVVRRKTDPQDLWLYRGTGTGTFRAPTQLGSVFKRVQMLAAVGDWNGDGRPDIVGQPAGGQMSLYRGLGGTAIGKGFAIGGAIPVRRTLGIGRWDADGAPDLVVRTTTAKMTVYRGDGPGLFAGTRALTNDLSAYNLVASVSSVDGDGHTDLVARASNGRLWLLPGTTGAGFKARVALGWGGSYNLIS